MPERAQYKHREKFLHGSNRIHGINMNNQSVDRTDTIDNCPVYVEELKCNNSGYGVGYNYCYHTTSLWCNMIEPHTVVRQVGMSETSDLTNSLVAYHYAMRNAQASPASASRVARTLSQEISSLVDAWASDPYLNYLSVKAMMPKIPRRVSILNFLYELKDLPRMFEYWSHRLSYLSNVANGFLNEEFNWRPFLSDVCTILNALQHFREGLRKFISGFYFPHTRHYQRSLFEDEYGDGHFRILRSYQRDILPKEGVAYQPAYVNSLGNTDIVDPFYVEGSFVQKHKIIPMYRATMKFTYDAPDLLKPLGELKALLDTFGVYWDPQVLWDAYPFSFIVDWFHDCGNWLSQQFAKPNVDVRVRIIDFCTSVKSHVYTKGHFSVPSLGTHNTDIPYWDSHKLYHRNPCEPILKDPRGIDNPIENIKKVFLALALGHNCSRPHKRH